MTIIIFLNYQVPISIFMKFHCHTYWELPVERNKTYTQHNMDSKFWSTRQMREGRNTHHRHRHMRQILRYKPNFVVEFVRRQVNVVIAHSLTRVATSFSRPYVFETLPTCISDRFAIIWVCFSQKNYILNFESSIIEMKNLRIHLTEHLSVGSFNKEAHRILRRQKYWSFICIAIIC